MTGHIDGIGRISRWERVKSDWLIEITAPSDIIRYIVFFLSSLISGLLYLVIAFTPQKRGIHDYVAGTYVVRKG